MGLPRGCEGLLVADAEPLGAGAGPRTASRAERLRLLQLLEPEQLGEETPGLGLAPGRGCELHVVDPVEHGAKDKLARMFAGGLFTEGLAELHTHLGGSVASDILWS